MDEIERVARLAVGFGDLIRSQDAATLGRRLDLPEDHVRAWGTGAAIPSADLLWDLCLAVDLTPSELLWVLRRRADPPASETSPAHPRRGSLRVRVLEAARQHTRATSIARTIGAPAASVRRMLGTLRREGALPTSDPPAEHAAEHESGREAERR